MSSIQKEIRDLRDAGAILEARYLAEVPALQREVERLWGGQVDVRQELQELRLEIRELRQEVQRTRDQTAEVLERILRASLVEEMPDISTR